MFNCSQFLDWPKKATAPSGVSCKVSISALRNMYTVTLCLVPSAFPTCVSVHVVWKREMLAEETGKNSSWSLRFVLIRFWVGPSILVLMAWRRRGQEHMDGYYARFR